MVDKCVYGHNSSTSFTLSPSPSYAFKANLKTPHSADSEMPTQLGPKSVLF